MSVPGERSDVRDESLPDELMYEFRGGSSDAAAQLVAAYYPELRRMASCQMSRERTNHTWQPTVLVHELYLALTKVKSLPARSEADEDAKRAFLGFAAFVMRRLLVHHARPLPSRVIKTPVEEVLEVSTDGEQSLRELEHVLDELAAIDPKLRTVVEMKVFEGVTREEIAARLGCSVRTVARHWEFAQHWLREALGSRL